MVHLHDKAGNGMLVHALRFYGRVQARSVAMHTDNCDRGVLVPLPRAICIRP